MTSSIAVLPLGRAISLTMVSAVNGTLSLLC
jgi:hypothetical protein